MLETRMELCNSTLILEFLYSFTASESQPVLQKDVGFQCSRFISTALRLFLSYGAACYYSQVIVKEDTCFQHALKVALLIFYFKIGPTGYLRTTYARPLVIRTLFNLLLVTTSSFISTPKDLIKNHGSYLVCCFRCKYHTCY
jgi:hypothetical protein